MDYETARSLAGSLGTVFLVASFFGVVLFAFRPGSKRIHSDSAEIPFRHDDKPAPLWGDDKPAPLWGDDKPAPLWGDEKPAPLMGSTLADQPQEDRQ